MHEPAWQKSSFSEDQANCIYLTTAPDGTIRLRESDDPRTLLTTAPESLAALLDNLRQRAT